MAYLEASAQINMLQTPGYFILVGLLLQRIMKFWWPPRVCTGMKNVNLCR